MMVNWLWSLRANRILDSIPVEQWFQPCRCGTIRLGIWTAPECHTQLVAPANLIRHTVQ
jgi:hypothetical protein